MRKKVSGADVGKLLVEECGFKESTLYNSKYYNKKMSVKDSNGNTVDIDVMIDDGAPAFKDGTNAERLRRDISDLEKYWSNIDKTVKHQVAQDLHSRGTWLDDASGGSQLSVEEIEKRIGTWDDKPHRVSIRFDPSSEELRSRNYGLITYADGNMYWGHVICAEFDFDHGYVEHVSIEG